MILQSRTQFQTNFESRLEFQTSWSRRLRLEHYGANDWGPCRSGALISLSRSESFMRIYNMGPFIDGIHVLCFGIIFGLALVAGSFFILFWEYNIISG